MKAQTCTARFPPRMKREQGLRAAHFWRCSFSFARIYALRDKLTRSKHFREVRNLVTQGKPQVLSDNHFLLDKTEKKKIGDTTFVVSSFLRTGQAPAFLDILSNHAKEDLRIKQAKTL